MRLERRKPARRPVLASRRMEEGCEDYCRPESCRLRVDREEVRPSADLNSNNPKYMPKYSGVTFNVQPVEKNGKISGYVVSGFLTKKQLVEFRKLVDSPDYKRSKMWRGEYMEMAQAIVKAVDKASA